MKRLKYKKIKVDRYERIKTDTKTLKQTVRYKND